jgi:multicomponent Na+:H+ antiporter subunit G
VSARELIVDVLLGAGAALALLACLGVVLMRDALDRLHYTAPGGLAVICFAGAVLVQAGPSLIGLRAVLIAAFVLVTAPVLAHATARAIHDRERGA